MVSQEDQYFEQERRKREAELGDRMHQRHEELMKQGKQKYEADELVQKEFASEIKSYTQQKREPTVERTTTTNKKSRITGFVEAVGDNIEEHVEGALSAPERWVRNATADYRTNQKANQLRAQGRRDYKIKSASKQGEKDVEEQQDAAKSERQHKRKLSQDVESVEVVGAAKRRGKVRDIRAIGAAHSDVQQMKTVHVVRPRLFRNQYGQVIPYDPDPLSIYSLATGTGQVQESGYDVTAMYRLLGYNPTRPRIQTGSQQTIVHHLKPILVRPESKEQGFSSVGLNNFINTFLGGGIKVRKSQGKKSKKVNIFTGEGMF